MKAKSSVYHNSHKVNKSGKSRSASGWNAWTHTTAAIRKSMARQSEPVPTGLHCHGCLTYGHTRLHLVGGRMVCDECANKEVA